MRRAAELSLAVAGLLLTVVLPTGMSWMAPTPENHNQEAAGVSSLVSPNLNQAVDAATKARVAESYGKLPMSFEANQGQTGSSVKYLSRGEGYSLFLTPSEAVLSLEKAKSRSKGEPSVVRMSVVGANRAPEISGVDELPGRTSYFIGNDPSAWRTDVPSYAKVKYTGVYPGIDLVYYGNQRQLEYDFVVAPGSRPEVIGLGFEGAEKVELDGSGDLVLHTRGGDLRQHKPVTYQQIDGTKQLVASNYRIRSGNEVGFEIGGYDESRALVIDPVLSYSTYLGGTGHDISMGIAVDAAGCVYLTGETHSARFPTSTPVRAPHDGEGNFDNGFVTKMNSSGNALMFNAYVGGSDADAGLSVAIDKSGNPFVTGLTYSKDFPVTATALPQPTGKILGATAFVTQLASSGMGLSFSSYLGGSRTDYALGVALDKEGNIYVTGRTESADFPATGRLASVYQGGGDVFLAKINEDDGLVYSITFGGTGSDYGFGVVVDSFGNAVVTGKTSSSDFVTAAPIQANMNGGRSDAFITKVSADGSSLVFSTYLGGSGDDQALGIALDSQDNIFLTGSTNSLDFPTEKAWQNRLAGGMSPRDAFITKLSSSGDRLIYSTYIGGTGDEIGQSITVDVAGNAYICGQTSSVDFPITAGAFQTTYAGVFDAFITALYPDGSPLLYSTFVGGKGEDSAVGITVDASGNIYVAGKTNSLNFPTTKNPFQSKIAGGQDAFVAKILPLSQ